MLFCKKKCGKIRKNKKLLGSNEKAVTSQISNIPPPQIIKNYIKTNKLHNTVITCICPFRPNPRDIAYATASLDKTIKLWSINFDLIDIIKMISFPSVYLVHYRTKRILSAEGLYIKVYDVLSSMTIKHILRDHIDDVLTMLLMVDNYSVISGGVDRVLRLWSVKEEKCIRYYEGHVGKVTFIDYINHHNNIISMSEDKTFIIWDIDSANELVIFNNYFTSTCLIGTQFGFVCGAYDNKLRLYNNQFKLFSVLYGNFYGTENLLMLSGKDLLFVNEKNEICILDINKKSMKYVYQGAKGDIVQVVKGCDWDSLNEDVWNEENNEIGNDMNGPNRDKLIVAVTEDGYVYTSKNGIKYDLFEGTSIGISPKKTSDIIFVMMSDVDFNVENHIVGWLFGAFILPNRLDEYDASITEMVDIYEKKNGIGE